MADRLNALSDHDRFLPRVLHAEALERVYSGALTLFNLRDANTGRELAVRLFYRDPFEKEGDLTLSVDDAALTLAGITFSITGQATEQRLTIGGLQASPGAQTRVLINEVSKSMHGMRPKAFALWCVQELCQAWSISAIFAVADEKHIYRHAHRRRDFSASYNEFWAESDGSRAANGFWQLPLSLRQRAREELKASRRKAHERRYAMLRGLQPFLRDAVAFLEPNSANLDAQLANPPLFSVGKSPLASDGAASQKETVTSVVVGSLHAPESEHAWANRSF